MKISQLELNEIKVVLGDYYFEVRDFFYNVCISKFDYKILITRRSYVLYKIFETIFHEFSHELPKAGAFEKVGTICNSHSLGYLKYLYPSLHEKTFLIVDDIIINGRTIKDIYETLENIEVPQKNIKIWAMVCNNEALCIEKELKQVFGHVKYVPEEDWKSFSNILTDFIIASNVGYVSFVNSYNIANVTLKQIIELASNRISKENIYDNINSNFQKQSIESKILFWDFKSYNELNKFSITTCIRLYQKNQKITVIPYVFLPALNKGDTYKYCAELLRSFGLSLPAFFGSTKDCEISLYQWTIKALSDLLIEEFAKELNLGYSMLFECTESYLFNNNDNIKEENNDSRNFIYDFELASLNEKKCISVLEENVKQSSDFAYVLKMYLKEMRQVDDERAENNQNRYLGMRISNILKIIGKKEQKLSDKDLLTVLINLWDCGKASFVIMEDSDENNQIIDGFLRHGEQIYLVFYEIFSKVYNVFYELFCQTFESRKEKLLDIAKYFDKNYSTDRFTKFVNGINLKHYVTDLMAIPPTMFSNDFIVENVQTEVKSYLVNKNKEK